MVDQNALKDALKHRQLIIFTFHFFWAIGEEKLDCSIWREPVIYRKTSIKTLTKISRPKLQRLIKNIQAKVEIPKSKNKDSGFHSYNGNTSKRRGGMWHLS